MATYKVQSNGKAPSGLKSGDTVVTGGGTYKITGVNSDGSYQSTKVSNTTTSNYTGSYTPTSSGSSSSSSSSSSSTGRYASTGGDIGTYGKNQIASGVNWQEVLQTYYDRQNKALTTEGLSQYANDATQQELWNYIVQAQQAENQQQVDDYISEWTDQWNQEQPTYESKYDPAMMELLDNILNRDDFSYDAQKDPLYQQYAAMYQQEGDRAMQETMAEAAASAGGMNSYAITAAQQANNYYASQMANKVPELYQLAYQMYLQDKDSMVQDLGILQNLDATQYNRYRDTMSDYYNDKNFAYGVYQDAVAQGNWQQNFDYNSLVNDRTFNYGVTQDNITNSWREKEWERDDERYEDTLSRNEAESAKEKAEAQVYALLQLGQMPSDALLAAADIDRSFASAYIAGIQAELARQSVSSSSNKSGYTGDTKDTGDDSKDDYGYEVDTSDEDDEGDGEIDTTKVISSLNAIGLSTVNADTVTEIVNAGGLGFDNDKGYYWINGWNKDNYQTKLAEWRNSPSGQPGHIMSPAEWLAQASMDATKSK